MEYQELYAAVEAALPSDRIFTISVETWRYPSGTITEWIVYVEDEKPPFYRAPTAEACLLVFLAAREPQQSIQETSAAVAGRPKPTSEELTTSVSEILKGGTDINPETVANLAHELTDKWGMELEIAENLLYWGSRTNGDMYSKWLQGCVDGKTASELNASTAT